MMIMRISFLFPPLPSTFSYYLTRRVLRQKNKENFLLTQKLSLREKEEQKNMYKQGEKMKLSEKN